MGGMQVWMWAGLYPGLMDVAVPLASQPIRISGRNWLDPPHRHRRHPQRPRLAGRRLHHVQPKQWT